MPTLVHCSSVQTTSRFSFKVKFKCSDFSRTSKSNGFRLHRVRFLAETGNVINAHNLRRSS